MGSMIFHGKQGGVKGSKLDVKEGGLSHPVDIQSVIPKCPKESGTDKVVIGHFRALVIRKGPRTVAGEKLAGQGVLLGVR